MKSEVLILIVQTFLEAKIKNISQIHVPGRKLDIIDLVLFSFFIYFSCVIIITYVYIKDICIDIYVHTYIYL